MKPSIRHVASLLLGVGLLSVVLVLIFLDGFVSIEAPERVLLREVALHDPPPPPPPPVTRVENEERVPALSAPSAQLAVELTTMDLDVEMPAGELSGNGSGDWGEAIGVDFGTVAVDELDGIPVVLTSPLIVFPQELLEQGIEGFLVRMHILIDESGRPYLIDVIESEYPAYEAELAEFLSEVRFSPPTFLGIPVRTEFTWPVQFNAP